MNFLFLHRNFPSQFRHIAPALSLDPDNKVIFISNEATFTMQKVINVNYRTMRQVPANCHNYLQYVEDSIIHGQATAGAALQLKQQGFIPDVIIGHSWGNTLFMKDVFPDSKLLTYFEWFYNPFGSDMEFDNLNFQIDDYAKVRVRNAHLLIDLYSCDKGITPTLFQKKQFPKEYSDKIEVMHDGIEAEFCHPDENAVFKVPGTNLEFSAKDEVITYATRGMEPYRGFPEFMRAVEILLKKRPNLHVIIGGEDRVCYGPPMQNNMTYKQLMLNSLDLDLNRIHFVGGLPYNELIKLFQISSAHVYLTYPFICSWSMLESMACACPLVASSTEPVKEFVEDGVNGLLFDFHNIDEQVEKIEYALDNKEAMKTIRANARQTILDKYALKDILPKQIDFIKSLVKS